MMPALLKTQPRAATEPSSVAAFYLKPSYVKEQLPGHPLYALLHISLSLERRTR
jgi:hypothetical protein